MCVKKAQRVSLVVSVTIDECGVCSTIERAKAAFGPTVCAIEKSRFERACFTCNLICIVRPGYQT